MPEKRLEKNPSKKPLPNRRSEESLAHFACAKCAKWWTIGDAPARKKLWYCPWCGTEQKIV